MNGIKNWHEDDRPREKMMLKGPAALSNAELIAILIQNGTREKTAVDLGREILALIDNNLKLLGKMSIKEIQNLGVKGIGEAKAISIIAALELGIRVGSEEVRSEKIKSTKDIALFLQKQYQHYRNEIFVVVLLNNSLKIIHHEIISEGGITGTIADPRVILKKALQYEATSFILCHNHPSGNIKPSPQDVQLTQRIKAAAAIMEIKLLDHIIISEEGYYSFADEAAL